jgi:hypothetical protein
VPFSKKEKKRGRQIPQKRGEAKETSWIRLGEKRFSLILICFMFFTRIDVLYMFLA